MIDSKGKIELVNKQIEQMFAYDKNMLIGKSIESLVPTRFHHQHVSYRESFFNNASARQMGKGQAVHGLRKDGIEFPAEIGLSQLSSQGEYKVLACIVDISEYVKVTNELKRSNKELNDFAYVASHDLKAPLRGIVQLAEWIEEDAGQDLGEESRHHFELLKNRTARLEKLLDDLLTYSRIERRESEIRECNVQSMVEDIFELLEPPKHYSLVCESPLPVLTTLVVPLEQIFRNLINNAIKHHDKDHAVITVSARETAHGYEFAVADDGPGILPEYHQRVFDIFQTLKPRDEVEGSGMGLAIIKKILDRYGERITIDAGSGRGCCFRFTWAKRGA
jgi:PAS domain S-box-containing protein